MARVLTLPLAVAASGAMATVTQDHPAEITQSVALLLDTRPGERRTEPEYGLPDPVFAGVDPVTIAETIAEWEPRADPETIDTVLTGVTQTADVRLSEEV